MKGHGVLTLFVVGLVLAILLIAGFYGPVLMGRSNYGFDDSWNCMPQAKGDPVCFRNR